MANNPVGSKLTNWIIGGICGALLTTWDKN